MVDHGTRELATEPARVVRTGESETAVPGPAISGDLVSGQVVGLNEYDMARPITWRATVQRGGAGRRGGQGEPGKRCRGCARQHCGSRTETGRELPGWILLDCIGRGSVPVASRLLQILI